MENNLLEIRHIEVTRAGVSVLRQVNITIEKGRIVSVIGPNGAGKSTLFSAIMGFEQIIDGSILFDGKQINELKPEKISKLISYVPQEENTFPFLSILDNLWVAKCSSKKDVLEDPIFDLFPVLYARKYQESCTLSGGERQMLALAIGLMRNTRMLLLDEPSLGLAPLMVNRMLNKIKEISDRFALTILVSEQTPQVLDIADQVYVLEGGQIRLHGLAESLRNDDRIKNVYLGVAT